jgi:hypothetical protein
MAISIQRVLAAGAILATSACMAQSLERPPMETRVAWLSECPHDPPAPPKVATEGKSLGLSSLIAVVGPKLIGGVVDAAAEALKAAGKDRDTTTLGRKDEHFYKVTTDGDVVSRFACMVVVRGEFNDKATPLSWARNYDDLRPLVKPMFYMEAKISSISGGKFFQLVPVYLQVDDFEKFSIFDPKDRDYQVAVTMKLPGQESPFGTANFLFRGIERGTTLKPGDPKLLRATSRPVAFPETSADAKQWKAMLEALISPYLTAIDILTEPKPTIEKPPSIYASAEDTTRTAAFCGELKKYNSTLPRAFQANDERCAYVLEEPRERMAREQALAFRSQARRDWANRICGFVPGTDEKSASCTKRSADMNLAELQITVTKKAFTFFTTDLTLTETREGSKLALMLGNAFASSKDELTAILSEKLVPKTQKQQDEESAASAAISAAIRIADLEVTKAEQMYAELLGDPERKESAVTAAQIAVVKAKQAANTAYRNSGLPIPHPGAG